MQCLLTVSDIIEIVGIIASLMTSIVAIVISIKALKQNSKMIEESTRPYVSIYFQPLFDTDYLILKNFGNSTAKITSFHTNVDFHICLENDTHLPFSHICNTYLHPGERILSPIDNVHKLYKKYDFLKFDICYKSSGKSYTEHIEINMCSLADHASIRTTVKPENAEKIIAETLQDIAEILL